MIQLSLIDWLHTNPKNQVSFYHVEDILELQSTLILKRKLHKGKSKNPQHILIRLHCKYLIMNYGKPIRGDSWEK